MLKAYETQGKYILTMEHTQAGLKARNASCGFFRRGGMGNEGTFCIVVRSQGGRECKPEGPCGYVVNCLISWPGYALDIPKDPKTM
jgi:hypothetical protein